MGGKHVGGNFLLPEINSEGDTHTYERIGDEVKTGNAELAVLTYFFGKENSRVLQSNKRIQ